MKYRVNEIFESIQGEGSTVGMPAIFIRLSGCNLECSFCDTKHSSFGLLSEEDIYAICVIRFKRIRNVIITGGEPLLQDLKNILEYFDKLNPEKINYFIETNGMIEPDKYVRSRCHIICSPKQQNKYRHYAADELKYVVDEQFDEKVIDSGFAGSIYLQPENNQASNIRKCIAILKENPGWRLSLQIQKLINIR